MPSSLAYEVICGVHVTSLSSFMLHTYKHTRIRNLLSISITFDLFLDILCLFKNILCHLLVFRL